MPKKTESHILGGTPFREEKLSMGKLFNDLENTANRLNATADAANELIGAANERLGSMGAGVEFASDDCVLREEPFSEYDEHQDREVDAGYATHVLAYGKIHGTWQMAVQKRRYVPGSQGFKDDYDLLGAEDIPLLSADREIRIKAASLLPTFLRDYTAHLAKLADKLDSPD